MDLWMCWLQHRGWSVVELQSTHLSFATQAPPPQFQLPITTSIVVTSKIAENNMQRLCPVDTVNVDDQTDVQFLTLFVIRSGPDLFRFQLKQCNACITVSAVCNRRAQQDLIHTDHDHFGRSFRLRLRKADKIVVLGLWLCDKVASGRPWQVVAQNLQRKQRTKNRQKNKAKNWIHVTCFEGCAEGFCSMDVLHVTPSTSSWWFRVFQSSDQHLKLIYDGHCFQQLICHKKLQSGHVTDT